MNASFSDVANITQPWNGDSGINSFKSDLLSGLPLGELAGLRPNLEPVRLRSHQIVHETGETIQFGYFVERGLMSIVSVQSDGKGVEVGLVGAGGFVGLPLVDGLTTGPNRIMAQTEGSAYRIDAVTLRELLPRCPQLELNLHRFGQRLTVQAMQLAACNALHEVGQRLARWLLMSHDLLDSKELPLTQDILGQMLGTRRSSVTVAAGSLQKVGIISCARGSITILDETKLQAAACECYQLLKQHLQSWTIASQAAA
jgi:CRP-like cAMP-binding protein